MRVLQLIDSLRPGGAERMAVSYANALAGQLEASFLCCTRMEGQLKEDLNPEVGYLFLKKRSSFDWRAISRLRKFIKENNIGILQAHSSSYFFAVLMKWSLPGLKLIWHDHYGRELQHRKAGLLLPFSKYFDLVLSVNAELEVWAKEHLKAGKVEYLRNFVSVRNPEIGEASRLKAGPGNFRIVCLANLRPQKDHLNLLRAFVLLRKEYPDTSLHLIGKPLYRHTEEQINFFIAENDLQAWVHLYGERTEVWQLLKQADLGVLASASEGLPVALLEYGAAGIPVVCTNVGQCGEVLGQDGILVPPRDPEALAVALIAIISDPEKAKKSAMAFRTKVEENYGEQAVMQDFLRLVEPLN